MMPIDDWAFSCRYLAAQLSRRYDVPSSLAKQLFANMARYRRASASDIVILFAFSLSFD